MEWKITEVTERTRDGIAWSRMGVKKIRQRRREHADMLQTGYAAAENYKPAKR